MKENGFCSKLVKLLFPKNIKCVLCKRDIKDNEDFCICEKCIEKCKVCLDSKVCDSCGVIIKDMGNYCLNCKRVTHDFDYARSYFEYSDGITKLIKDFKFEGDKYLDTFFGDCLLKVYRHYNIECDVVTVVPIHKDVLKKRGFNQSELIARDFAKKANLPTSFDNLIKIKPTPLQVGLSLNERKNNLKGCFKITDKNVFDGKTVVLIDDVLTTGATADECSKVLKRAGAERVILLTVANVNKQVYSKEKGDDCSE